MSQQIAYLRVSTSEQHLGIEAQRESIRSACGADVVEFVDQGISGATLRRPGLTAALAALQRGDVMWIARRDRLARDVFLALWIEREITQRGATLRCATGEISGTDPAARLMSNVMDAFSQFEREMIGARTSAALKAKRSRGEKTGGTLPYGSNLVDGRLLAKNVQEQLRIEIMRSLRKKKMSYRQIVAELIERNIPTKTGARWHPGTVRRILHRLSSNEGIHK